ncbi:MAG: hypothetical protein KGI33_06875 [Thaumarchaeota archaeon]|nr:hypothetical protein [Nitrososphaerota archaeon]
MPAFFKMTFPAISCIILALALPASTPYASADNTVQITKAFTLNHVIFDGKWTFDTEWKESSLNDITYNDTTRIELRSAHQGNYLYFMIDALTLTHYTKNADRAIICLDANHTNAQIPGPNDYCFAAVLDGSTPLVLQGGSSLAISSHYRRIPNPDGLVAVGGISGKNDRYTPVPHESYEFRIPTALVGRSDTYGIYAAVYDYQSGKAYSFPPSVGKASPFAIPSPASWAFMTSPDHSLPEFPLPAVILPAALSLALFVTRLRAAV